MTLDLEAARRRLAAGDIAGLFTEELGWYPPPREVPAVQRPLLTLRCVAQYNGFLVFHAHPRARGCIPRLLQPAILAHEPARFGCDHLVVLADRREPDSLWVTGIDASLPAYRLGHERLSGRLLRILDGLCFWDRNPLELARPVVAGLVHEAFAETPVAPWRLERPRGPSWLRPLYEHGKSASTAELRSAEAMVSGVPPGALPGPVPLDTVYSPANRNLRRFSRGMIRADLLESVGGADIADVAFANGLRDSLGQALDSLMPRERLVLELRFGMDGAEQHTLERVGAVIGTTRERVRQIEARALRKLRHPSHSRRLQGYLPDSPAFRSPWPEFWKLARGHRFRVPVTYSEEALAELEARLAGSDAWDEEERARIEGRIEKLRERVQHEAEDARDPRRLTTVDLRARTGTIRLTDVAVRACQDFQGAWPRRVRRVEPPEPPPVDRQALQREAILHVAGGRTEELPRPGAQAAVFREFVRHERRLQVACQVLRENGYKVEDRRLDGFALWVHDPSFELPLKALLPFGLVFQRGLYRGKGGEVRGWWTR